MNERIKELAEQAGYKDLPTVRLAFHGFDKEKFADLIVAECIGIAANQGPYMRYDSLVTKMREHFGVEE